MSSARNATLFLALGVCWGGSFPAIEVGLTELRPLLLGAYRFDLGAAVALAYVFARSDDPVPSSRTDLWAVLVAGLLFVVANIAFLAYGQRYTTGGIASIVYSLNPILTTFFTVWLLGEGSLDARGYAGVVLGVLGVALVAQPSPSDLAGDTTVGVALVFVAAVAVSFGSVATRWLDPDSEALPRTAWGMALGAVILHGLSVAIGEPQPSPAALSPAVIASLAFLGVFASAVGYAIYFGLLDLLGPFEINLVSYVVPVVATVSGAVLLSEPVTPLTVVGFAVVVVGFVLVKREAVRRALRGHTW
ncbi:DMT family transporter [Halobaculum sp. CBA1158]|uniref:DMT family transporter n=1 Tax=Halobaculum sp. CBA1158 TaxID=2904243 RepID=UPI001F44D802|nr:DMT family transporter [Halobaculum sp. CBA1158]UIO98661.1 DMT family transporter [Halobaculum sp. CBA1158]